ncbi:hypothetical protein M405DRAFT_813463 [Rhizopogon salebrosus TDB-379]|nr:hypothetical protein M405DRAFT_813463 [Rhizopogon salebrosus TDB-379]
MLHASLALMLALSINKRFLVFKSSTSSPRALDFFLLSLGSPTLSQWVDQFTSDYTSLSNSRRTTVICCPDYAHVEFASWWTYTTQKRSDGACFVCL